MEKSSSSKYDIFKGKITFSSVTRFFSIIILIYIIDYVLSLKDTSAPIKWKLIIICGGIEVSFFYSITKVVDLLTKINNNLSNRS
ncbi:MAG: hypothetical protein V1773_00025 [bacterium]